MINTQLTLEYIYIFAFVGGPLTGLSFIVFSIYRYTHTLLNYRLNSLFRQLNYALTICNAFLRTQFKKVFYGRAFRGTKAQQPSIHHTKEVLAFQRSNVLA